MQIRLLGPMQVWQFGEPVPLGGPRQRAVLAILALNANRTVPADALVRGLWGDRPSGGAVNAVQVYISRYRRALALAAGGAGAPDGIQLLRHGAGYLLRLPADEIDLTRFEALTEQGRREVAAAPRAAAATLREALDLWRGGALLEFAGMPFAEPEIVRLDELHRRAVGGRIDADLALGRHVDLLAELELLTAAHPLDEGRHAQFVLALYRAGRQADALDTYRGLRSRLAAELGRPPTAALTQLERAVLDHDPRLDWRGAADVGTGAAGAGDVGTGAGPAGPPRPTPSQPAANAPSPPRATERGRVAGGPGRVVAGPPGVPAGPGRSAEPVGPVGTPGSHPPAARRRPDVWNVPARNPHFTGRDAVLRTVAERLGRGEQTLVVQALYGLGGVGKSQVAVEFAHRQAHRYRVVWWMDAEQPMLIGDQIARLAPPLGLARTGSAQETVHLVLAELAARTDWLLIFDNAERVGDVAGYRPSGTGHILITSRTPGWGELGGRIAIDLLDRAETMDLFRSRLPAIDDLVAADLAGELGDLPLAVAQAVAHIEQSGMDPAEYLRQFSTRRSAFLARGEVLGYQGRVDTAWDLSLERLRATNPAALELLTRGAFLGPEPIPRDLFTRGPAAGSDPFELAEAIGAAAALSLLRRTPTGFDIHRLVQEVIRAHLPPDDRDRIRNEVVDLLAAAHPGDPNDPRTWTEYAALVPHVFATGDAVDAHPGARRLLIDALAYFNTISDTRDARRVAGAVHDRWRRTLGPDHPDTLTLAAHLTLAMMWDGAAREGADLGADSLRRAVHTRGPDDLLSLRLASYVACTRAWLADADGARALATDTLDRVDRVMPADDPGRLRLTAYLALALVWVGDPTAVDVAARTRDRAGEVLGPDHPTTLMAGADVCLGRLTDPDTDRTRRVALDTTTRARAVLGTRHLITLGAAATLALADLWCDDRPAAALVDAELLTATDHRLDPDHVVALIATAASAAIRAETGVATDAVVDRAAIDRARRLLGPDHPVTLITAAADPGVTAQTAERIDRVFGPGHPLRARVAHLG
ncbi:FxSxx-COOH system tetratricopeptide repeat protein [Nakamurella sp.]|uniref:FxSxx-COOH system tetratricopeptide repeat protein n=1 Tax=Nakamurella sp. TaxID=1869182 RepID=UPI0037842507